MNGVGRREKKGLEKTKMGRRDMKGNGRSGKRSMEKDVREVKNGRREMT